MLKSFKVITIYKKIDGLKSSQDINKVIDSFNEDATEVEILISDSDYQFDKENAKIAFNSLKVTEEFPFIKMVLDGKLYYKIHTQLENSESYIEIEDSIEYEDNQIYIFYNISIYNKLYNDYIKIDLETSKMLLKYPSDGLSIMKEKIIFFYPNLKFIETEEKNMTGDFEITFKNYDETKLYYLTLFDNIFSEFLFVREVSTPRSLKENIKYYYVGTDENRAYNNYSIY